MEKLTMFIDNIRFEIGLKIYGLLSHFYTIDSNNLYYDDFMNFDDMVGVLVSYEKFSVVKEFLASFFPKKFLRNYTVKFKNGEVRTFKDSAIIWNDNNLGCEVLAVNAFQKELNNWRKSQGV